MAQDMTIAGMHLDTVLMIHSILIDQLHKVYGEHL